MYSSLFSWLTLITLGTSSMQGINTELFQYEIDDTAVLNFQKQTFASCKEVEDVLDDIKKEYRDSYYYDRGIVFGGQREAMVLAERTTANVAVSTATPSKDSISAGSATPHSTTNVQIAGIDEPDIIKNDGKYFYILDTKGTSYSIESSRSKPSVGYKNTDAIVILDIDTLDRVSYIALPDTYNNPEFFVLNGKLVLTATQYVYNRSRDAYWYNNSRDTIIATYDLSDIKKPKLERFMRVEGYIQDSRLTSEGRFIAVTQTSYAPDYYYPIRPMSTVDAVTETIANNSNK